MTDNIQQEACYFCGRRKSDFHTIFESVISRVEHDITEKERAIEAQESSRDTEKSRRETVLNEYKSIDEAKLDLKSISKNLCPICGKPMMTVHTKKKGQKTVCSDKRCGFEESANQDGFLGGRKSRKEYGRNKRLVAQYSDHAKGGSNLGDLLKAAMENKED